MLQHLLDLGGDGVKLMNHIHILLLIDGALGVSECQGQEDEACELPREGFGGSHANLRSHMDIDARVGLACDARTHGVDDAEDASALLLGQLDGCQRVGGLTTL